MSTITHIVTYISMNDLKTYISVLMILVFLSCSEEKQEQTIDAELQKYFQSFQQEARSRGVDLNLEDEQIDGYISNISGQGVIGNCTRYASGKKELTIDTDHWNTSTDSEKELVVFHELGHCILGRVHTEEKDRQGKCVSIMTAGKGACKLNYATNRTAYLNELFK